MILELGFLGFAALGRGELARTTGKMGWDQEGAHTVHDPSHRLAATSFLLVKDIGSCLCSYRLSPSWIQFSSESPVH